MKSPLRAFFLSVILILGVVLSADAQQHNFQESISRSVEVIQGALGEYPGICVTVIVNGERVWSEGFGWADIEGRVKAHPDQGFRLYSISKTITGLALAQLEDRAVLDINTPIRQYLPQLPAAQDPVLVRHLVNHSAGIRHYRKGEWMRISRDHCATTAEAINHFSGDPLEFITGTKFQYSSFGFVLLGSVMEAASQKEFRTLIRETVLMPAQVKISFDKIDPDSSRVRFYERKGSKFRIADAVDNSCKFGGGGMNGSVNDLAKLFAFFLSDSSPLSAASRSRLITPIKLNDGSSSKYGYGWQVLTPATGETFVVNTGSGVGGSSVICYYPSKQLIVVMATNIDHDEFYKIGLEVGKVFCAGS